MTLSPIRWICSFLIVVTLLAIFTIAANAQDSPLPTPTPEPDFVGAATDDITANFEGLSGLAGLGVVVSLLVMLARRFGLPDGWGGYAAFAVGVFVYGATRALSPDVRNQLFDAMRHAAQFLTVILGGQVAHASAKYAGLDRLWKGGEWVDDTPKRGPSEAMRDK